MFGAGPMDEVFLLLFVHKKKVLFTLLPPLRGGLRSRRMSTRRRAGGDFVDAPDAGAGDVGGFQAGFPGGGGVGLQGFFDFGFEGGAVFGAPEPVGEAGVVEDVWAVQGGEEDAVLFVGEDGEEDEAVAALEQVGGGFARGGEVAGAGGDVAHDGVFGDLLGEEVEDGVKHGDVDELAAVGVGALLEGGG